MSEEYNEEYAHNIVLSLYKIKMLSTLLFKKIVLEIDKSEALSLMEKILRSNQPKIKIQSFKAYATLTQFFAEISQFLKTENLF